MKNFLLMPLIVLFSYAVNAQSLDKIRIMCSDEIDPTTYNGKLSPEELKEQFAALGFRYIENGKVKYHKELIVYDCNTGNIKFTAIFDENRLVKEFVLYGADEKPAKEMFFSKGNQSDKVNLTFNYKGQQIPAYPIGETKVYNAGKLKQQIQFSEKGELPFVTRYNENLKKIAEGSAFISGNIQEEWNILKRGEWKYFKEGKLLTSSVYDNSGKEIIVKSFQNGVLEEEQKILANEKIEKTLYYPNGKIKENGQLIGSTKIGVWENYDIQGQLKQKTEYLKGKQTSIMLYEDDKLIKKMKLINESEELLGSLATLNNVFEVETFHSNGEVKTLGFEYQNNTVGVLESYNNKGDLIEISKFDNQGKKINSLDADVYVRMKQKEKQINAELLVAETTHPENTNRLNQIESLSQSLSIDFDSLMINYNYVDDYQVTLKNIKEQTHQFGELTNTIAWYDSLLNYTLDFTNQVWAYSHDLFETELYLEKQIALNHIDNNISTFTQSHTKTEKRLFGEKIVVINEQEEVYNFVVNEIYKDLNYNIEEAKDKYKVKKHLNEFDLLLKNASIIINQPDNKFRESFEQSQSINDKKQLFLTVR